MAYRIRPGVMLLNICGQDILAARHDVWEECPRIRPIPKLWAACWHLLEEGKTERSASSALACLFRRPEAELHQRLEEVFSALGAEGFLIETPDGSGRHDAD